MLLHCVRSELDPQLSPMKRAGGSSGGEFTPNQLHSRGRAANREVQPAHWPAGAARLGHEMVPATGLLERSFVTKHFEVVPVLRSLHLSHWRKRTGTPLPYSQKMNQGSKPCMTILIVPIGL